MYQDNTYYGCPPSHASYIPPTPSLLTSVEVADMPSEILFSPLTATGPPPTYHAVVATYRQAFNARVAEGALRPLVIPYAFHGYFLLIAYLCINHTKRPLLYAARWPVLAIIIWIQWRQLWEVSSGNLVMSLVCGLWAAWGIIGSVCWLILYRPQFEAKRVQRRVGIKDILGEVGESKSGERNQLEIRVDGMGVGRDDGVEVGGVDANEGLRSRVKLNGYAESKDKLPNGHSDTNAMTNSTTVYTNGPTGTKSQSGYYWQSYPNTLSERLSWILDLLLNFRGPGWNWAIAPLPPIPQAIRKELGEAVDESSPETSPTGLRTFTTRRELIKNRVPRFILYIFLIDLFKTLAMHDPYFLFGPNTYDLPSHLAQLSSLQLRFYRTSLTLAALLASLEAAFLLMPLLTGLLLGPSIFGQRVDPWYFPSNWGDLSNITDKGLNGLWGSWWHQTFRIAFAAPTTYLIKNKYVKARSFSAKFLALVFAFGISGWLHSWGSISMIPKTNPQDPVIFFLLQAPGILIQTILSSTLRSQLDKLPKVIRQIGNAVFTFLWLFWTAPWLIDDFARGGVWLYEPIPFSPLRGLGFGPDGKVDGFYCWEYLGIGWHTGEHWWGSGISY